VQDDPVDLHSGARQRKLRDPVVDLVPQLGQLREQPAEGALDGQHRGDRLAGQRRQRLAPSVGVSHGTAA
jgi:hypothetical protein